jgi:hypothetical protein
MLETDTRCFVHHMRGLFDRALMERIRGHMLAVESERQAQALSEREKRVVRIGAATDVLRLDPCWYDLWRDSTGSVIERVRPYTWVTFPVQVRHVTEESHLVPWHQDVGYQRLLGARAHRRIITCFVPLEPDADACSTLEFALGDFEELRHQPDGDHGATTSDPRFARTQRFGLAYGDALIFGDHTPHRTVVPDQGRIDRHSFEFRLVIPGEALDDKDYFDLATGRFVRTDGTVREFP